MGQKVHPYGFRVIFTKNWHSKWYSKRDYATLLHEDLKLRKELLTDETLEFVDSKRKVVHFVRPNGWHSITNFGKKPVALPAGTVRLTSAPLVDGKLPGNATAWITQ